MLNESKKLEIFNSKKIFNAVRMFSKSLDPNLENDVVEQINQQFNQAYKKVLYFMEQDNY